MRPTSIDAFLTDPPYGISFQSAWSRDKTTWHKTLQNDDRPAIGWLAEAFRVLKDGGCIVVFNRWDVQEEFRQSIEDAGFKVKAQIVWDRGVHGMGDLTGNFAPRHDVAWFAVKGRFKLPGKRPVSVIQCQRPMGKNRHPTEKPVDLMKYLLEHLVPIDGICMDPFMGTGSTGVAALSLRRRFVGVEINKAYFSLARERMESLQLSPQPTTGAIPESSMPSSDTDTEDVT
jgi:site-specific DNA-methyltransferase (adenine-specific)